MLLPMNFTIRYARWVASQTGSVIVLFHFQKEQALPGDEANPSDIDAQAWVAISHHGSYVWGRRTRISRLP